MWTSKLRTAAPYITGGVAASVSVYFAYKHVSRASVAYASGVPVKPFKDTHVVIVGGGYGGINLANKLKNDCQLTLIDARDSFHHNMGAQRASIEKGYIEKCLIPFEPTFGDKFKKGKVVDIDVKGKTVTLGSGESVSYDELVIATGTGGPFPCKLPVEIDSQSAKERYNSMVQQVIQAQNIVVIGGGAVGVEIAGDIKEDYKDKHVVLIHPREILVNDKVSESFQSTVKNRLKYLGVETVLGERVSNMAEVRQKSFTDVTLVTDKGTELKADLAIECTGLKVNSEAYRKSLGNQMDQFGRLKVDEFLQIEGVPDIYAIGDCNSTPEIKLAMLAKFHANHVGDLLKNKHEGKPMKPYKINEGVFFVLSCGRSGGAAQVFGGWVFGDWFASFMKGKSVFTPMQWKTMGQKMPE